MPVPRKYPTAEARIAAGAQRRKERRKERTALLLSLQKEVAELRQKLARRRNAPQATA